MQNLLFIFLMVVGSGNAAYAQPVVSKPLSVEGFTFFKDSHDENLFHAAPSSFSIRKDEMGPRLSIVPNEDGSATLRMEVIPAWSLDQEAAFRMHAGPFANAAKLPAELEVVDTSNPYFQRIYCRARIAPEVPRFCEVQVEKDYVEIVRSRIKEGYPRNLKARAVIDGVNEAAEPTQTTIEVRLQLFGDGVTWL